MPPIKDLKTLLRGGRSCKIVGHTSADAISLTPESLIKKTSPLSSLSVLTVLYSMSVSFYNRLC
jgi:hypothetical protein